MNRSRKSIVFASMAVLSWSTVATAFKVALSYLSVFETLFIACATALVIFTILMTIEKSWGELRKLPAKVWITTAVMGLINPVAYYLILFESYDHLPAQVAQPINYFWPIALLILLAIFNKQPIPKKKYIGMIVSLAGLTAISLGGKGITGSISAYGLLDAQRPHQEAGAGKHKPFSWVPVGNDFHVCMRMFRHCRHTVVYRPFGRHVCRCI